MAYTTIDDPSAYFHTRLYSGNNSGSGLAVTNNANSGNFQPDWVWIKRRDSSGSHGLHDSNRGSTKRLKSDANEAEDTNSNILASFDSNGFTIGDNSGNYNASGTYVGWQWKANGGTTSSNTDGSITSTVQANTTAGFSIVTFSGTGSGMTVGHGLGSTPELIISKSRNDTENWAVHTTIIDGSLDFLRLSETDAKGDSSFSLPTSTVFGYNGTNNYIAYVFHSVQGYSKFGSYTGNGSSDGTFVYTGFRPAFVIIKRTDSTNHWLLFDVKRDAFNVGDKWLRADTTDAEATGIYWDGLSNGLKPRTSDPIINASGGTYIYMAFAEHPFVSSKGVPTTAR